MAAAAPSAAGVVPAPATREERRRFYEENGYLLVKGILPRGECNALRQELHDLGRFTTLREHHHGIIRVNAAQIAVKRLGRVHEMGPRSGRGQRRRDLLPDEARLADPRHDHGPAAAVEELDRAQELLPHAAEHRPESRRLGPDHAAAVVEVGLRRGPAGRPL